ncbi:MAG TPA: beta-propeller fold lactonase family protein [Stellaceae bacterium]|nr:beta-propeller fold lactonase family protein [Stellaceae bacterium]
MAGNLTRLLMCALFCSLSAGAAWADGAVYAMTNAVGNNQILVFHRAGDGTLTPIETVPTGGGGSGAQLATATLPAVDALGSQGSLQLDKDHHLLFAVNTESLAPNDQDCQEGTITSFFVLPDGSLSFADRVRSGGLYPNSLTVTKLSGTTTQEQELLYVLNAGGPGANPACGTNPNITGFKVNQNGRMTLLRGSKRAINPGPLNGTGSGVNCPPVLFSPEASFNCGLNPPAFPRSPAEVRFTPDAKHLLVTVKGTNSIYVFPVGPRGLTRAPTITQAPGPAVPSYFGFTFDTSGHVFVTELFGTATVIPTGAAGAVSSFTIASDNTLSPISASVGNKGTATCWITLEPKRGQYAYVANNLSNTLASYTVGADGTLTLLQEVAGSASGPNDLAVAAERRASFIYALNAGNGTVGGFRIHLADGSLTPLPTVGGLPPANGPNNGGAQGLAAY